MVKPIIVTFYSFRGGVGRSMAMLNAGYLLARSGRRVLLVDFDLEAPGLTRLIERQDILKPKPKAAKPKGFVDLLHSYLFSPKTSILNAKSPSRRLNSFIVELDIHHPEKSYSKKGSLHLMPAGRKHNYEKRLDELSMNSHQFKDVRKAFATRFRKLLLESGQFDYIFIDARTGFSDEGYIASKFLCDHLIVLSGLNDQNIKGTAEFMTKLASWKQEKCGPDRILLVASPVCEYEDDKKAVRYREAQRILKKVTGADLGFTLSLPYHPRLALYEELVAIQWPQSGLGRAYMILEYVIRDLNEDTASHWAKSAREALERRKVDDCADAIENLADIDRDQAVNLARQTSVALAEVTGERARAVLPIFDRLEQIDRAEPLHALQAARVARNANLDSKKVLKRLDHAFEIARKNENLPAQAAIYLERARTLANIDQAGAHEAIQEFLQSFESIGDQNQLTEALLAAAQLEENLAEYSNAQAHAERALSMATSLSRQDSALSALNLLVSIHRAVADYKTAKKTAERMLQIARSLQNHHALASAILDIADLDFRQGNYQAARRGFEKALEITREKALPRLEIAILRGLAELDKDEGDFDRARKRLAKALANSHELNDKAGVAAVLHSTILLERHRGNYVAAKKQCEKSLFIYRRLNDLRGISSALQARADVDRLQGKWTAARKGYEEAIKIDRHTHRPYSIAMTLHAYGEFERVTGNYNEALRAFEEALTIYRKTDLWDELSLLKARAEAAHTQIDFNRSLTRLRSLVNRAAQDPYVYVGIRAFLLLGSIERERCLFKKALKSLEKAHDKAQSIGMRDVVAFAQAERALCLSALDRPDEAKEAAAKALDFFKAQDVRHSQAVKLRKLTSIPTRPQRKRKTKKTRSRAR